MKAFHYVYVLRSLTDPGAHYTGLTDDLHERLRKHNAGGVPHTAKHMPWVVETAVAFRDRSKASTFERYLKTGSGRVFARRHF